MISKGKGGNLVPAVNFREFKVHGLQYRNLHHAAIDATCKERSDSNMLNALSCDFLWPHGLKPARLKWVAIPSSWGSSRPQGLNLSLLTLRRWQAGSLPPVPPGKPPSMLRN